MARLADGDEEPRNVKLELIVFDLGGVIVRSNHGWEQACRFVGLPRPAILEDAAGMAALTQAGIEFETGRSVEATFLAEAAKLTGFSIDQVRTALHHWLIEPYPGAKELIEDVTDGIGIAAACLSNTNATHWAMMHGSSHAAVPLHRLEYRFASHLIGAMKPDEAIYQHVEQVTGAKPSSILFFDDHPPNVEAARRRGWNVEQIDPAGDTVGQVRGHLLRHGVI